MFVYQLLVPTTLLSVPLSFSCLVTLSCSTMRSTHTELLRGWGFLLHFLNKNEGRTTSMTIYHLSELDGDPVYTFLTPEPTPPCRVEKVAPIVSLLVLLDHCVQFNPIESKSFDCH